MLDTKTFLAFLGCVAAVVACESYTDIPAPTPYAATLDGASERPTPVTTSATGTFTASLHPTSGRLSYTLGWTGLSGAVTGAHLHGPADASGTAEILVDFEALPAGSSGSITKDVAGSATGELDLTLAVTATVSGDSLRKLLNAGRVYVNVHTVQNVDGEIRGQIARQ